MKVCLGLFSARSEKNKKVRLQIKTQSVKSNKQHIILERNSKANLDKSNMFDFANTHFLSFLRSRPLTWSIM